jgi:adenylate kinase family enzyme
MFFGRSGCGKGTQAALLSKHLKEATDTEVLYMETGREFRSFSEEKNYIAEKTRKIMGQGGFLPAFLPIWIWSNLFIRKFDGTQHLILDGLARKIHEAPVLDSTLKFLDRTEIDILYINVSHNWAFEHMMNRGRSDDAPEKIEERLRAFDYETRSAMDYFRDKKGYNFHEINGEQPIEGVHAEILKALSKKLTK